MSKPAIEGWFTTGENPQLLGRQCIACQTIVFPPTSMRCPNPRCPGAGSAETSITPLSRRGTVWSATTAGYQPPSPYVSRTSPFEPFALVAVELAAERMVLLGQVADGYGIDDVPVGTAVELVLEPLYEIDGVEHLIYRWEPTK